ncbi:MAG: histone deacetylase, partial [Chitinophagaceae bacterium]
RNNYPFRKEKSDLDIALEDGTTTEVYMSTLQNSLPRLLEQVKPDLAFYLSGVDILESDKFGKLKVTLEGCKQRDSFVLNALKEKQIPCVGSMGGGYSADIKVIVEAHCNTYRQAKEIFSLH